MYGSDDVSGWLLSPDIEEAVVGMLPNFSKMHEDSEDCFDNLRTALMKSYRGDAINYDECWDSFLAYYFPVNFVKNQIVASVFLESWSPSSENLYIYDLGCGPGSFSLAFVKALEGINKRKRIRNVYIKGVDVSGAQLTTMGSLLSAVAQETSFRIHKEFNRQTIGDYLSSHTLQDNALVGLSYVIDELGSQELEIVLTELFQRQENKFVLFLLTKLTKIASSKRVLLKEIMSNPVSWSLSLNKYEICRREMLGGGKIERFVRHPIKREINLTCWMLWRRTNGIQNNYKSS